MSDQDQFNYDELMDSLDYVNPGRTFSRKKLDER